jgi:predicted DNA-binding antitoxin AbrB/MazE fold protein
MMVRFELDAVTEAAPKRRNVHSGGEGIERMDRCLESMRHTPVGEEKGPVPLPPSNEYKGGIKIHRTLYPTPPLSSYLEKNTRSSKGELDYVDIYGQLVFSQTPHLYVARHTRGNFTSLEKVSLGEGKLRDIEISTTGIMGKVAGMIKEMMECVDEFGECWFI